MNNHYPGREAPKIRTMPDPHLRLSPMGREAVAGRLYSGDILVRSLYPFVLQADERMRVLQATAEQESRALLEAQLAQAAAGGNNAGRNPLMPFYSQAPAPAYGSDGASVYGTAASPVTPEYSNWSSLRF